MKHLSDSVNPTPENAPADLKIKLGWRRALHWTLALVAVAWVVVLLAWSALHIFILPRIENYREVLQQQASRIVGTRVEIGSIRIQGGWLVPWFEVNDLVLFDHEGREALRMPRVLAAVSPRTVWSGQFEQLDIENPELEIRRDANGHIWVAGRDIGVAGDGSGADWLFSQPAFLVRQGVVHWRDERQMHPTRSGVAPTPLPVLTFQNVDVWLKNGAFEHALQVDATPPLALGQRLSVRGKFHQLLWQRPGDTTQWSGELFADVPYVDFSALRPWLPRSQELSLQKGRGALRLWTDVRKGQPVGVTADAALSTVTAHLGPDLLPLGLRYLQGRLSAEWQNDEVAISSQDLVFDTREGEHWPGGVLRVNWRGDAYETGAISADRLDLDALAQISQRLPLSKELRGVLARVQPQGQVNQLKATWQKNNSGILNYSARGQVRQLAMQHDAQADSPLALVPGVQAAQIEFDLTQAGGRAGVSIHHGSLTVPAGLETAHIALTHASAQLAWQLKGDTVAAQFTQGHIVNDDVTGKFNGNWKTGTGQMRLPGVLDLTATLSRANVAQVHRYLPTTLPASVRSYVRDAIQAGEASRVTMRLRGDLNDMPFEDPALGEFRVVAQIAQGKYAYVPPPPSKLKAEPLSAWPALTELNGELVFDRSALHFKGDTQLEGAPNVSWQKVKADIPNLAQPVVSVTGEAHGPVAQVLDVIAKSALNELTNTVLSKSQATGAANYKLALALPIDQLSASKVQGSVTFTDSTLQINPDIPALYRTRGTLQFSEQGLELKAMRAQWLGGHALLEGGLSFAAHEGASPLQLKIRGDLTAEGLQQASELGFVSHLAQRAKGQSSYSVTLGLRRGQPELLISSDLKGMALSLPEPLNKSAQTSMPLRIETQLTRESLQPQSLVLQDQIKVVLGDLLAVAYVRDLSGPRARIVRGGIAVGPSVIGDVPMRDNAVSLNLQLPTLDIDAWNTALTQLTGVPTPPASPIDSNAVTQDAPDYMPTWVALRADQIKVSDRLIHRVLLGGTRQGNLWRVNISADELNGFAEVRPPNGDLSAQLYVRLAYLNIPPSSVPDVEQLFTEQPSSIPTLDIVINDLTLRGKKLGRLEINAANRISANAVREWRLNKFNITLPEATLTADGTWAAEGPRMRRTQLNFVLALRDSGELLTRLGTADAIRHGEGRLEGQVSWQGSPITLDYASMSGKINLLVEKGQFLKGEPGAARLLGVLNLQALPRRLTLDFSDVFSDGFAFDFVRGDVRIEHGVAFTNNLQMKGVVGGALLEGSVDLVRETQQLKVVVVPEINAGTAALYAATINPLIGLTSYLAQTLLSKPLVRAGTREFHVNGTWADPHVTKVD